MNKVLRWYDLITINVYYLGLTTLSQTMTPLVLPLLVQQFVGEQEQGQFYGNLRLWSLMVALLVQSLTGMLSDRSTLRFGKRRPFILVGTLADLIFIVGIAALAGYEGRDGYWLLLGLVILLMISSNTAHGAQQGLIPDLVPESLRGRASAIKAIMEVPLPLILVAFTIGRMIAAGNLWTAIFVLMGVLILTMVLTMFAPESAPKENPLALNWEPFIRLVSMTALFTLVILGTGWLIRLLQKTLVDLDSIVLESLILGVAGVLAMSIAIGVGVIISVRMSIGSLAASTRKSFSWWVVNRLAYLVGSTNLASFAVFFLQGRLGYAREEAAGPASQMLLFVGVFILLTAFPSGWLADRLGNKPLVAASGIIAVVGTIVTIASPTLSFIYVGAVLVGIATGLFYTANWALGTQLVPPDEAGRYLGISNLAGAGAGAVGAYIGGPIADYFTVNFPQTPGLGYVLLFAIYGTMFLLSVLVLRNIQVPNTQIIRPDQ